MKRYFAENLKNLRKSNDIIRDKLAEFIGVAPQTISKWERAETYPDIETLPRESAIKKTLSGLQMYNQTKGEAQSRLQ